MSSPPPPPLLPGLTNITHQFQHACLLLPPSSAGQLVKQPSLGMLDAMNALTVMDPRMDAGVVQIGSVGDADADAGDGLGKVPWIGEGEGEEEGMTLEEVCGCIDRLVENEMLFNTGWPLVPTVFTSRHFRLLPTLRLHHHHHDHPSPSPAPAAPAPPPLFETILLPYLHAYNLSLAYSWSELVTRMGMYEGEDWMGDTAGLWAEGEEFWVGGENGGEVEVEVEVESVLRRLGGVVQAVQGMEIGMTLLYNLVTCVTGTPPPSVPAPSTTTSITGLLPRLYGPPHPLPRVTRSFDTHSARLFRQSMPPVPTFVPQAAETVAQRMGRMVDGLAVVGELKEVRWGEREEGVWVFSMLGMGMGRGMAQENEEMPAVVRSCLSWSVMTPAQGDYSPTTTTGYDDQPTILAQWMQTHAWVEEFDLERVLYSVASVADSGAGFEMIEAVRRFFYHLSDNIRLDIHDRSQNRARQYRQLPLCARRWLAMAHEMPSALTRLFPALQPALRALYGDTLLDALLGTFDLDLITPGREGEDEYGWMYWFISRVARDRLRMGQEVADGVARGGGSWRTVWARAWTEVANALFLVFTSSNWLKEKSASNASLSSGLTVKTRRRAVFEYRFRPFISAMVDDAGEPLSPSYMEYMTAYEQVEKMPSHALRREIQQSFESARHDFQAVELQLLSRRAKGPQQQKLTELHKAACQFLAARIEAYTRAEGAEEAVPDAGPRVRKWLPPVQDVRSVIH